MGASYGFPAWSFLSRSEPAPLAPGSSHTHPKCHHSPVPRPPVCPFLRMAEATRVTAQRARTLADSLPWRVLLFVSAMLLHIQKQGLLPMMVTLVMTLKACRCPGSVVDTSHRLAPDVARCWAYTPNCNHARNCGWGRKGNSFPL